MGNTIYIYPKTAKLENVPAFDKQTKAFKNAVLSILSVLTAKTARAQKKGSAKPGNWINIPSNKLRSISKTYRLPLALLVKAGIVEVNDKYKTGDVFDRGFSKSYRLGAIHRRAEILKEISKTPRKRRKDAVNDTSFCQTEVEAFLAENIRCIEVDFAQVAEVSAKLSPAKQKAIADSVEKFAANVANLKRGKKVNRVFSVVTQAPKELRPCFRVNGSRLAEIDVKSCQPVLLLSLCPEREREAFAAILKADFYSVAGGEREKNKKAFGQWIAGSRRKTKFAQKMAELFPGLSSVVATFNGTVAAHLQNEEAKIVIDGVCARLMTSKTFVAPIHDALLVLPQDVERVRGLIAEEFKKTTGFDVETTVKAY